MKDTLNKLIKFFVLLLTAYLYAVVAHATTHSSTQPVSFTIGVSSFEGADSVWRKNSHANTIKNYLTEITKKSKRNLKKTLNFEIAVGNYYQIYEWQRSGLIDAAVTSAFTAELLSNQNKATPIAEFSEIKNDAAICPLIAAAVRSKNPNPIIVYKQFLADVFRAGSSSEETESEAIIRLRNIYDVAFITHFSSSGFTAPLLFAKSWLLDGKKEFEPSTEKSFWNILLGVADFSLYHGNKKKRYPDLPIQIRFTYSGQTTKQLEEAREDYLSHWYVYDPKKPYNHSLQVLTNETPDQTISCGCFSIPNDQLVISDNMKNKLYELSSNTDKYINLFTKKSRTAFHNNTAYVSVNEINQSKRKAYHSEIVGLFGPASALNDKYRQWYEERKFRFRISETIDILKQDAKIHGQKLALVLPGGGVKSLYQAALLDRLHKHYGLRNIADYTPLSKSQADRERLEIHNVIGTSGGAMVGALATLGKYPIRHWVHRVIDEKIFPFWDFLRYTSFMVVLFVLMVTVLICRLTFQGSPSSDTGRNFPHKGCSFIAVLILLATPFLIHQIRMDDVRAITILEGMLFAALAILCHFILVGTSEKSLRGLIRECRRFPMASLVIAVFLLCLVTWVLFELFKDGILKTPFWPTTTCLAGSIVAMLMVLIYIYKGHVTDNIGRQMDPLYSFALLLVFVLASYGVLGIFQIQDKTSLLELTGDFWEFLLLSSLIMSVLMVIAVLVFRKEFSRIFERTCWPGGGFLNISFLGTLIAVGTFALILWGVVVTPAIYSDKYALNSFKSLIDDTTVKNLTANLVVTESVLHSKGNVKEGDYYFCAKMRNGDDCTPEDNWFDMDSDIDGFSKTVFASGVPFPIFPPQLVDVGCEKNVPLVDGGYAHNVPLHASHLLNSRRALVIHSTPREADTGGDSGKQSLWPTGQLVTYSKRILPFLFKRAQVIDQMAAGNMVVVSLAPSVVEGDGDFPQLTHFTDKAVKQIRKVAIRDIRADARIGTIDQWGIPGSGDRVSVLATD